LQNTQMDAIVSGIRWLIGRPPDQLAFSREQMDESLGGDHGTVIEVEAIQLHLFHAKYGIVLGGGEDRLGRALLEVHPEDLCLGGQSSRAVSLQRLVKTVAGPADV